MVEKITSISMSNPSYGGFWLRFLAQVLDLFILGIPLGLIGILLQFMGLTPLYYLLNVGSIVLVIVLNGKYGGTPGKLILGLRIVNEKGEYIGVANALLRYICSILSALILCIGYFMIGWDEKKQGLHDRLVKTYVVKVK